jgi:hypothetical protein
MKELTVDGDFTLDKVFDQNRLLFYSALLDAIEMAALHADIDIVDVMKFVINGDSYSVDLNRSKFQGALYKALQLFEYEEAYEYCVRCVALLGLAIV